MGARNGLRDCQAQPDTLAGNLRSLFDLVELLKYFFLVLIGHAWARIGHGYQRQQLSLVLRKKRTRP